MSKPLPRFIFALLGARRQYAPALVLHEAGCLARIYTDINSDRGWPRLARFVPPGWRPGFLQRIAGRTVGSAIPPEMIYAFNFLGLEYAMRRRRAHTDAEQTRVFLWMNQRFGRRVVRAGFDGATAIHTFNGAGLELLRAARAQGLFTVTEQTIAPKQVELELLRREADRFPGWEPAGDLTGGDGVYEEFCAREREEWDYADVIVCGSEFVRDTVAASGGPVERCVVVPYGLRSMRGLSAAAAGSAVTPAPGPLRVLTVGSVGLRKGSQYVLEAARRLRGAATFRLVGPVHAGPGVAADLARETELVGPTPRASIHEHFAWADVFLLPSLCEGSAMSTYEALAAGVPVIATPNSGTLVRDGVEGFIVPAGESDTIVERLELLRAEPDRLAAMKAAALARSEFGSMENYAERLRAALGLPAVGVGNP